MTTLLSRRQALVNTALTATSMSLLTWTHRNASARTAPTPDPKADHDILNALLAAEYDGVATYQAGAEIVARETDVAVRDTVLAVAAHFQQQHQEHAAALAALIAESGGTPITYRETAQIPASFPVEASVTDVLRLAADKEKRAAYTYVDVLRQVGTQTAAKLISSIGGVESQHFVVLHLLAEGLVVPTAATLEMAELVVPAAFVTDPGLPKTTHLDDLPALDEALALRSE